MQEGTFTYTKLVCRKTLLPIPNKYAGRHFYLYQISMQEDTFTYTKLVCRKAGECGGMRGNAQTGLIMLAYNYLRIPVQRSNQPSYQAQLGAGHYVDS